MFEARCSRPEIRVSGLDGDKRRKKDPEDAVKTALLVFLCALKGTLSAWRQKRLEVRKRRQQRSSYFQPLSFYPTRLFLPPTSKLVRASRVSSAQLSPRLNTTDPVRAGNRVL